MILVDTSVWIDHLNTDDSRLRQLLSADLALAHPFVIGEIALGHLRQREAVLEALHDLPQAVVASNAEVLRLINRRTLFGSGVGYVDVHLLAAVRLTAEAALWTRDRRLRAAAGKIGVALFYAD